MQDATDEKTNEASDDKNDKMTNEHDKEPTPYSLREWLYDLQDDNGEPLIHATYPSAETSKIFVLCKKAKSIKVLQLLHNLIELAAQIFPETTLQAYFGEEKALPLVHNHPRTTAELSSYASTLASYATVSNPQEEAAPQTGLTTSRGPKRSRDGVVRQQGQSYAAVASVSTNFGADVDGIMKNLQSNLDNLQSVEAKQKSQDEALEQIELRFQRIEGGLEGHGKLLTTLSNTQSQQGKLLTSLNDKMDNLTKMASSFTGQPISQEQPNSASQDTTNEPNTSQGGPEGMES